MIVRGTLGVAAMTFLIPALTWSADNQREAPADATALRTELGDVEQRFRAKWGEWLPSPARLKFAQANRASLLVEAAREFQSNCAADHTLVWWGLVGNFLPHEAQNLAVAIEADGAR